MPVRARRMIRKMRGGAQAHLLEADDGQFYVVKFRENPQHRRILINELIAYTLLDYLQIAHPKSAIVEVTPEFLAGNPQVHLQFGTRRVDVKPGWAFGSRFPGDPARTAVYDFLPDVLLPKVANFAHFLGAVVFDKWMGNADARQCIFLRARLGDWLQDGDAWAQRVGFVGLMIDHGYVFDGPQWGFLDSPLLGLYFRTQVYEKVRSFADFQPWLDRVQHCPEDVIDRAWKQVPGEWLDGDEDTLEQLLERLLHRRKRVPDLLRDARNGKVDPFPNWR